MSDFLGKCACNGHVPLACRAQRTLQRSTLISRLLRERHVPRYIVAPSGYGKSTLALQYAETVFSLQRVFWIDCASPCFLRDLDAGLIAERLKPPEGDENLIVFDEIPLLDSERSSSFIGVIDDLLAGGSEVLVTCTPSCDVFAAQHDRVRLNASDLLFSVEELETLSAAFFVRPARSSELLAYEFVPALACGESAALASFIRKAFEEDLPADLLAAMLVMFALGKGSLADAAPFLRTFDEIFEILARDYPHFCLDLDQGTFNAPFVSVEELALATRTRMEAIARVSLFPDSDSFVMGLADKLLQGSSAERACSFMLSLATGKSRGLWLERHDGELISTGCIFPAHRLFARLPRGGRAASSAMLIGEAFRCALLGDADAARHFAERAVQKADLSWNEHAACAMLMGTDFSKTSNAWAPDARRRLMNHLISEDDPDPAFIWQLFSQDEFVLRLTDAGLPYLAASEQVEGGLGDLDTLSGEGLDALRAALVARLVSLDPKQAVEAQATWLDHNPSPLCFFSYVYLMKAYADSRSCTSDGVEQGFRCTRDGFEMLALRVLEEVEDDLEKRPALPCSLAAVEAERFCEARGVPCRLSATALTAAHEEELRLFSQRKAYTISLAECTRSQNEPSHSTITASFSSAAKTPMLHVSLFGGMEVSIGAERVSPALLSRQKVRLLLALLVLNGGKEYSRDYLARLIWPDSVIGSARNNLYSIWSTLKKALSVPAGGCPYLIRQQQGLRIDATLLDSDVRRFDDLCRTLQFERPGYNGWASVHEQVRTSFSADLLPSEMENECINGFRRDYRGRLVDALVAASGRLVEAGEVREGLWFAHAAVMRDRLREDAHAALISAQLAAGQRTAALDSFFECRRILTDDLGIDPSPTIMRLYHRVIGLEDESGAEFRA